jgi:Terminase-like family.
VLDGEVKRTIPRGAIVRYREWYGSGDKLTADVVGRGLADREANDPKLSYGALDPSAFKEDGGPSIAERINDELIGKKLVPFSAADNTRIPRHGAVGGWDQMRSRLIGKNGVPMIYCFSTCADSIRTIPTLQHDPNRAEDVNTESEDHAADEWRYACMSRPWIKEKPHEEKGKSAWGYRPVNEVENAADWRMY